MGSGRIDLRRCTLPGVLVAGAAAGAVAIGATVAVERLGGRLGGLLGTLPTTIVPAAAGIWAASSGHDAYASAMGAVPVGMWVNVLFLLVWREAPARLPSTTLSARLAMMVVLSLLELFWAARRFGNDRSRAKCAAPGDALLLSLGRASLGSFAI